MMHEFRLLRYAVLILQLILVFEPILVFYKSEYGESQLLDWVLINQVNLVLSSCINKFFQHRIEHASDQDYHKVMLVSPNNTRNNQIPRKIGYWR